MEDKMTDSNVPSVSGEPANLPSEAAARNPELLPEIVRSVVNEFIGVYRHAPQPSPAFGFTWEDIVEVFKKRLRFLIIGAVVGIQLAVIVLMIIKPLYAVSAQVVITQQAPGQLIEMDAGSSAFIATQAEVMHSLDVVQAAVATLPRPPHLEPEQDGILDAMDAVQASAISGTRVIALGYLGVDPDYGAALLNAMIDVYLAKVRSTTSYGQTNLIDTKDAELKELLEEISREESQLNELRRVAGILGTADEAAAVQSERLKGLAEEIAEARNQRIKLKSQVASGGGTQLADDRVLSSLREDLRQAESELAKARTTLTFEHPTAVAAERNVEVLRAQLASSDGGSRGAVRQQVDEAIRQEKELAALEVQARERLRVIEEHRRKENKVLVELERMQSQADKLRSELLDERLEARLAKAGDVGIGARVIAEPVVPSSPMWPKKAFMLFAGAALGLAAGFVFALLSLRRKREPEIVEW
jgi:polysaccharide biosynthesis transport protein